jgi:hypothetical protein
MDSLQTIPELRVARAEDSAHCPSNESPFALKEEKIWRHGNRDFARDEWNSGTVCEVHWGLERAMLLRHQT